MPKLIIIIIIITIIIIIIIIIIITLFKEIPLAGFRIPKPWIVDSTDLTELPGFRIPDYLTWGDTYSRREF